jgi:predicted ATPase
MTKTMINKISFKNYKLFKEKQTIELKPITILIGKNNSGKSAVLKLMTLIEGALSGKNERALELDNDGVISGYEFKDLIYGKFGRALEIELYQHYNKKNKTDKLSVSIVVDNDKNLPIIESWSLKEQQSDESSIELLNLQKSQDGIFLNEIDGSEYLCYFNGIYLSNYFYKDKEDSSGTIYQQPFFNTDFIGSIREKTKLDYRLNPLNDKSNPDGRFLYDFLIRDYLTTDKIYFTKISDWIAEKFEGWNLYVDVDSEPYHIQLRKEKLEIDITETGMGIGQSLPLITRAYKKCDNETLIIIEEPESHLHPYAHSQIAQLFYDSIKEDSNKKYLIETHSESFILRMRKLIADKNYDFGPNDIRLYYVEYNEQKNESSLKEIEITNDGEVEWWPEGVFDESLKEVIEIRKVQNI